MTNRADTGEDRFAKVPAQLNELLEHGEISPEAFAVYTAAAEDAARSSTVDSSGLTARERGLLVGHAYASRYEGDRAKLRPIVMARRADEVRANVDSTVIEPAELESAVAFWSGFAHGVAAFLVEDGRR